MKCSILHWCAFSTLRTPPLKIMQRVEKEYEMGYELDAGIDSVVKIKVVGIGGGGNNAVNRMIASNVGGVEYIAVNTDKMVLFNSSAQQKIPIGEKITKGHGAGANPDVGSRAAEESIDEIIAAIEGADMVFVTAGMGGGTGTGAAPVVAKVAKDLGILTVGIVTKPFGFEGKRRMEQAEAGIAKLGEIVDSLIVIHNERLKQVSDTRITLANAFDVADDVLRRGVASVVELINGLGIINLDFADVTTIMHDAGYAHMGVGSAKGKDKAETAARAAISSPLLETSITGARGIIINITASPDIGLEEIDIASNMISAEAHPDATVIWGAAFDQTLEDEMRITVIATGFDGAMRNTTVKAPEVRKTATPVAAPAPAAEPVQEAKEEESVIPQDEFDYLIDMLKKKQRND